MNTLLGLMMLVATQAAPVNICKADQLAATQFCCSLKTGGQCCSTSLGPDGLPRNCDCR